MSKDKPQPGPKRPEYEPKDDAQRIAYFIEECGEVLAAAGKTLRWGLHSYNPEIPEAEREANGVWLRRELRDLQAAIERLDVGPWERLQMDTSPVHVMAIVAVCGTALRYAVHDYDFARLGVNPRRLAGVLPELWQTILQVHTGLDYEGIP